MFLFTFSWMSQLKHLVLRAFLAGNPQKTYVFIKFVDVFVSNAVFYYVLNAFLLNSCSGGPRRLWMSGSALAELWEALGELWEALYIEKLPINRPSGRYANIGDTTNKNILVYSQSVDTMY